ncbi:3-isopropylmalate dehydrogenase [Corynebacterium choanae]|uniref:3-isopropylmalate dehydrogenase n=1 Tax=Corynebacterium choanae TaxID=1862358 RepID=A0A3G6J6F4_9CORY|nr:3-isopropylmalate dehydrogenase [Corynebacterium choanae]AZA13392.1 3-isopropylmalate dehydrogenase [Corynebacterium choanae]
MKLAVIGGDGIGPEVTHEALRVLTTVRDDITVTDFDLGAGRYQRTGELLTDDDITALHEHDAILLGAVGAPGQVPPGVLERGLLLRLRFDFDHHVNLRPVTLYPGATSPLADPGAIDFVVVREGTEGLYCGNGGTVRGGTAHEIASEVSQNTRFGIERVVRDAFARAAARRGKLTLVHKTNVLVHAGCLWERTVAAVAPEFPDVTWDYCHIDAATIYMVTDPGRFDVIVTDNLFGDILTDLAGAITGGIGLAASGNIDTTGTHPSMFEPVHGSAPDIAGQGIADPRAAIISAALLLEHLGDTTNAQRIIQAVANDVSAHAGQPVRTSDVGDRIVAALSA